MVLCEACARLVSADAPSPTAVAALLLGLFGFLGLVPGFVGLALGYRELTRVREGTAPATGAVYARIGVGLGWFYVAVAVAGLGVALQRFLGG